MARVGSKPAGSSKTGSAARSNVWLWLTVPIAILVAIAAGVGFLVEDLYRDTAYFAVQAVGQDLITLVVALPTLVVSALLAGRGSIRGYLVWLGVLVYLVYSYVIYALSVQFNSLFLAYVALLGCSLYALIGGLASTDFSRIKVRFSRRTPVRTVSSFLAVLAVLFYFMWLSEAIPAVLAGEAPQSVIDNGTPTNAVHVLDMAWILPATALTAIWLWRGRALGYTLAGVLLSFLSLLALAIISMIMFMVLYGQAVSLGPAAIFAILFAISLWMVIRYLRGLEEQ